MSYDSTIYRGSAAYYVQGRPLYSRTLASTLAAELGLDGSGRLLDVGCGPGTITIELAATRSPSGLFWDWPGDTEILLARKPR